MESTAQYEQRYYTKQSRFIQILVTLLVTLTTQPFLFAGHKLVIELLTTMPKVQGLQVSSNAHCSVLTFEIHELKVFFLSKPMKMYTPKWSDLFHVFQALQNNIYKQHNMETSDI